MNIFAGLFFYNFRRGLTQQQCIDELNSIFGNKAPSRTSVYRWYVEWYGRSSLLHEFREGRPKSAVVPETMDPVRQLILQDRHMTYREIVTTLGISGTSIHSILHEKNLFVLDPTQFVNRSKKVSYQLVERNAPKIR